MDKKIFTETLLWINEVLLLGKNLQASNISALFEELKDYFTNEEIVQAAKQIVKEEDLYGSYPNVKTWLKYTKKKIDSKKDKMKFLSVISFLIDCPDRDFDIQIARDMIKELGVRAYNSVIETGLSVLEIRTVARCSEFGKNKILFELMKNWDNLP